MYYTPIKVLPNRSSGLQQCYHQRFHHYNNYVVTSGGSNLTSLQSYLQKLELANITVTKQANLGEKYFLESIRKPFLTCLIDNLIKRFEDKSILTVFDVFDPKKIPRVSNDSSESDSEEEIKFHAIWKYSHKKFSGTLPEKG